MIIPCIWYFWLLDTALLTASIIFGGNYITSYCLKQEWHGNKDTRKSGLTLHCIWLNSITYDTQIFRTTCYILITHMCIVHWDITIIRYFQTTHAHTFASKQLTIEQVKYTTWYHELMETRAHNLIPWEHAQSTSNHWTKK